MHRLLLIAPLLLASCAETGAGPSLAKRPIESRDLREPVRQATPAPAADAELRSQIDGLVNRAQGGQREFAALLPRTQSAASAAGPQGSESWIEAQQALSVLEGAREGTTTALAGIDALISERLLAGGDAGLVELQSAERQVSALADEQQRTLDQLQARISR